MRFGLVLVTPPAVEPVTLGEAKLHAKIDVADDDVLVGELIIAARDRAETTMERALVTQVWDVFFDHFPFGDGPIRLPMPPLQAVATVKFTDANLVVTTVDSAEYFVDLASEPGRIVLQDGESWPSEMLRPANGVEVRFTAGYGDAAAVPDGIKQYIRALVAHWYNEREGVVDTQLTPVPEVLEALAWQFRVPEFA